MPRRPRDLDSSTWFHVNNRGCNRQDIYRTDSDRFLFEQLMADALFRHGVTLHAYALMTNHFHLLVECVDGDVSAALHRLSARYAAAFNERHQRTGPLFTGRFWSDPIVTEEQRVVVGLYVHRNPLAFVPMSALSAYRWSSLGCYTARRACPPWLATDILLPDGDGEHYLSEVLAAPQRDGADLDRIVQAVADTAHVDAGDLLSGGRGTLNRSRAVAILIAVELQAAPQQELAARFGVANARGIRQIARRARERLAADEDLTGLRDAALLTLELRPAGPVPEGLNRREVA